MTDRRLNELMAEAIEEYNREAKCGRVVAASRINGQERVVLDGTQGIAVYAYRDEVQS